MFFVVAKLFSFFIDPAIWLIIIVVIAAFLKPGKWRKGVSIAAFVMFLFFTNKVVLNTIVNAWQPKPVILSGTYSASIVLGGFSSFDKEGKGYLNASSDRFITTANLYHKGIVKKIIVSGGDGTIEQDKPKEAEFARDKFIENGIPAEDVFSEVGSRDTYENAIYSKRILDSLQLKPPYVLVTSALHMRRAEAVFKKVGMDVVISPCAYETLDVKFYWKDYIIPDIDTLFQWRRFLKEAVGLWMYKLAGRV